MQSVYGGGFHLTAKCHQTCHIISGICFNHVINVLYRGIICVCFRTHMHTQYSTDE